MERRPLGLPIIISKAECQRRREDPAEKAPESNESGVNAEPPAKKARGAGAPQHGVASSTAQPSTGTVEELPDTPNDVCTFKRLGPQRFGAVWTSDAVLLKTLPQGEAKLAMLTVREVVSASQA